RRIPMKTTIKAASILVLLCSFSAPWLAAQHKQAASKASAEDKSEQTVQPNPDAAKDAKDPLENMKFRNLGPAVGGGRATSVVGIPGKPNVYYAGTGGGGVFLTTDGGLSWKPVFEKESTSSIGAIALAPSNPSLVWVGTGEKNIRNDVITGKGVFFSPDG